MKKLFLYFSIAIILLGIPISVFLVSRNQDLRKRAAPATTLFLSPAVITKNIGETFSLDVKIDTAENQVGVIQLKLEYDPTKLEAVDITNGALAPTIRVSGKIDEAGVASITVGAKSTAEPITESGTIAVVTLKAIAATTEPITVKFSAPPETYANALSEGENNVLIGMTPATVTIQNLGSSLTPTLTPTATPLVTPTATPIATLSGTLTPTLTPTQSATPAALSITSIQPNENITTSTPTFSGSVQPGYTITLTIYSEPRTVVVTVDENGNWTYTPEEGLDNGPHTVVALATNPTTGETQTSTVPFVVNGEGSSTESAVPVTGSVQTTMMLLGLALLCFIIGGSIPFFTGNHYE